MTKSALRDGPLPRGGNGSRPVASSETAQASGGGDGDVLLEFVDGLVRADDLRTSAGVFDLVGVLLLIGRIGDPARSEEHTSELQSRFDLVCRLLLEKKKM